MALNEKQERFVGEYLIDLNATQAAIRAGYSEKTAYSQGQRLLKHVEIQTAITEGQQKRAERTEIDQDWVINRYASLASADPNELCSVVVGSCRYCHGTDHQYQWRDEAEFEAAQEAHFALPDEQRVKKDAPVLGGGFGYMWRRPPHAGCPQCDGMGRARTVIKDTTDLSENGQVLYAGVKETQHGVEIKMHDQLRALEMIARHLGMFPSKVEVTGKNGGPIEQISTNMSAQEAAEAYEITLDSDD